MSDSKFTFSAGELTLQRLPLRSQETLQAWDAADTYLLDHFAETKDATQLNRILVINDNFGALSLGANVVVERATEITHWSDSYLSQRSLVHNGTLNQGAEPKLLAMNEQPSGHFDAVLFRVPKSSALLEYQLQAIAKVTNETSVVLGCAMEKHLARSVLEKVTDFLGECHLSLGRKKARVLLCKNTGNAKPNYQRQAPLMIPEMDLSLHQLPGVFSKDKLDLGSRLLIEQFGALPKAQRVADIGCGNGVLAVLAQRHLPNAHFYLCDNSYMAVETARQNGVSNAEFAVDDGLAGYTGEPFDLVLLNPPFHQDQTMNSALGRRLVEHALKHMASGAEIWLVANTHLKYGPHLRKRFGNSRVQARTKKFEVLVAKKR